jgi:hypothetical protein
VDVGIGDGVAVAEAVGDDDVPVDVGSTVVAVDVGGFVGDGRGVGLCVGAASCTRAALLGSTVALIADPWEPPAYRAAREGPDWAM